MSMPNVVLEKALNKNISLLLKDGSTLSGSLSGFDEHMNMVLDDTEENQGGKTRRLGTVILRGNNVVSITIP